MLLGAAPALKDAMEWPTTVTELRELVALLEKTTSELNKSAPKK